MRPGPVGFGLAIESENNNFIVLSVIGKPNENQLMLTSGVLKSIKQNRLVALDACNRRNSNNTSYNVFLHDADIGWDIIIQCTYPVQLLVDVPPFLQAMLKGIPLQANEVRNEFTTLDDLGGTAYLWNEDDVQRVFMRSMV